MSKYRITLHVHEVGNMSKEDFRKLQEAVDVIAGLTELLVIVDQNTISAKDVATMISMIPAEAIRFAQPDGIHSIPEIEIGVRSKSNPIPAGWPCVNPVISDTKRPTEHGYIMESVKKAFEGSKGASGCLKGGVYDMLPDAGLDLKSIYGQPQD